MKNTFTGIFALLLIFGGTQLKAQDNIVKLRLGQLAARNIELTYERVTADNQSLAISLGVRIPTESPINAVSDTSVITGIEGSSRFGGFSITPEYRFYLGSEGAPYKFYIGPYLRYRRWGYEFDTNVDYVDGGVPKDIDVTIDGNWSAFGGGVTMGVQWLINDVVSIDWNIVGLGIAYNTVSFTGTTPDPDADWAEVVTELEEIFEDTPVLGNRFEATEDGASASGRFGFGFPSLRANLSVGIAF
ncbi:MAG: DUF3575 domain-containing protein [Bacteroidota bacterium]